jgi:hypothetical protein
MAVRVEEPPPAAPRLLPRGRTALLLCLIVLGALGIRLAVLDATASPIPPPPTVTDAAAYRLLGTNLAHGRGYIRPFDLQRQGRHVATAEYPPVFPAFLAAADVVGISSETWQRRLLCVVGSLTVGLVGLVARRFGGDVVGLGAAGLAALQPAMWSTDTSPLSEPLAAFLGMAIVLTAVSVWDRPRTWSWVLLGALTALGGLVRTEVLLMGVLLIVPLAVHQRGGFRRQLTCAGLAFGAMVLVLAPWTIRNWLTFHQFVPISNNVGSALRGANCDGAYRGPFKGLWVTNINVVGGQQVDPQGRCFSGFVITRGQNEAQAATVLRNDGVRYVLHHMGQVPGVVAVRVLRTVGLYHFDQQVNFARFEGRTLRWDRWGTRLFQLLAVVALLGLFFRPRDHGPRWILGVPLLAVLVTVASSYGNFRFRAVADPVIVVLAALAVGDFVRWLQARAATPAPS